MSITTALKARRESLRSSEDGFTLIELLVVVIIIGILAAIAIPIYIGVQNNAKDSAVQSDLSNAKTAVVAYAVDKNALPTLDAATLSSYGYTASQDYTAAGASAPAFKTGATITVFCIQATGPTKNSFFVTSGGAVAKGTCP